MICNRYTKCSKFFYSKFHVKLVLLKILVANAEKYMLSGVPSIYILLILAIGPYPRLLNINK